MQIKFHDSYTTQKNILDQVMEEKNKLLLELENLKKDLQLNSTKVEHTEQLMKQKTKDLAEAQNDLAVVSAEQKRKNFQDSIKRNLKVETDPALMKIDLEEVMILRAENEKLTVAGPDPRDRCAAQSATKETETRSSRAATTASATSAS